MSLRQGREFLSIPGPTNIPDRVLAAMHRPAPNIYEGEIIDLTARLLADLGRVARTAGETVIYVSNGHGAWEAALANLLVPGDRILVLETGRFAAGWGDFAERMGAHVERLSFGDRTPVDPDRVEARLRADRDHEIRMILVVQVDTASSVWNDIAAIRAAIDAAGHPALLLVDGIASVGCTEYEMDRWGVDLTVFAAQKGLMCPPGLGFLAIGDKARAARGRVERVSPYFDWRTRLDPEIFYHTFAGTPPTHHLWGLGEALAMLLEEEGLEAAWARHHRLAAAIHAAVSAWAEGGALEFNVTDAACRAPSVTTILTGPVDSDALRAQARDVYGLVLGIGLGAFGGRAFRIGHMGWVNAPMVMGTLGATEAALKALGAPHGDGLSAAAAELARRLD